MAVSFEVQPDLDTICSQVRKVKWPFYSEVLNKDLRDYFLSLSAELLVEIAPLFVPPLPKDKQVDVKDIKFPSESLLPQIISDLCKAEPVNELTKAMPRKKTPNAIQKSIRRVEKENLVQSEEKAENLPIDPSSNEFNAGPELEREHEEKSESISEELDDNQDEESEESSVQQEVV